MQKKHKKGGKIAETQKNGKNYRKNNVNCKNTSKIKAK